MDIQGQDSDNSAMEVWSSLPPRTGGGGDGPAACATKQFP